MFLLASELPRAMLEFQALACTTSLLRTLPRGDGHTVLVLPGLSGDDPSTSAMRWFVSDRGYRAEPWGLGRNLGPTDEILDGMAACVERLTARGAPISVIGWSLGGMFARELGRQFPERIRRVITLGSPFRLADADLDRTNAAGAYRSFAAVHSSRAHCLRIPYDLQPPMPVPTTSVYTRGDGVAPWQSCVDAVGDRCENIEVLGSHCGLGHNPLALAVIADRLAQPAGTWTPYEPPAYVGSAIRVGDVPTRTPR